jgi:hypothetical protein
MTAKDFIANMDAENGEAWTNSPEDLEKAFEAYAAIKVAEAFRRNVVMIEEAPGWLGR